MKNLCFVFFFFLYTIAAAQYEKPITRIQDFNQDQIDDTLRYELLRGYISRFPTFTDGNSHQSYEFHTNASQASFLGFISVPEKFLDGRHQVLLDSVRSMLCYKEASDQLSPSLKWLMDAYTSNNRTLRGLSFAQSIQVPLTWHVWPPEPPGYTYSFVDSDSLSYPVSYNLRRKTYIPKPKADKGWLLYYGHNHGRRHMGNDASSFFQKIDSPAPYELFGTQHGLILKKEQKYSWIFHTDIGLTDGPGKLRWPSMDTVFIHQDHAFVHHISPVTQQNRVFIINLENGMVGKLRLAEDFGINKTQCFSIQVQDQVLIVSSGKSEDCGRYDEEPESISYPLEELFLELDKLYITKR